MFFSERGHCDRSGMLAAIVAGLLPLAVNITTLWAQVPPASPSQVRPARPNAGEATAGEAVEQRPSDPETAAPAGASATGNQAAKLVEQLGDAEFTVRERATQQLIDMGLSAAAAVQAGCEHPDREIRYRSRRILAIVRDQDFESRLQAFLSDQSSAREYGLPGWKQYREFAGDNRDVRELFVEMQRAEPRLLEAIGQGPEATSEVFAKRINDIQEAMQVNRSRVVVRVGTVASLLFATLHDDVSIPPLAGRHIYSFLSQPSFNNAIHAGGGRPAVLRDMLAAWIRRRSDPNELYQLMMLALRYDVQEGLVPATRALRAASREMNQAGNAHLRQYGLLTVARFGGKEHVALVEPLLEDKTPYGGQRRVNNVNYRTQIRDIALATLLHLTGQDPQKYGFKHIQKHPQNVFNPSTLAFAEDKEREAAIQKWRDYRATAGADVNKEAPPADGADEQPTAGPQENGK